MHRPTVVENDPLKGGDVTMAKKAAKKKATKKKAAKK